MKQKWSWQHAIIASDLPPTTRHLLLTLACHMTPVGENCFPSLNKLSEETGLNRATVKRHLTLAHDAGWLDVQKTHNADGTWKHNRYFPKIPTEGGGRTERPYGRTESHGVGAHDAHMGAQSAPNRSDNKSYNTSTNGVFDEWWSIYPKKVAKKACQQKWRTLKLEGRGRELVGKLKQQVAYDSKWKAGYAPNPLTYLNQERWDDEIQRETKPKKPTIDRTGSPRDARVGETWEQYEARKRKEQRA